MPADRPFPWRDVAAYAPIAIVGGAFIGFMMSGFKWSPRGLLHGALIGFFCFAFAIGGEAVLHRWIGTHWWRRALVYFVGAQIGWLLGMALGILLIWQESISNVQMPRGVLTVVLISGGIGTFIGLAVHTYEALKDRLRESIEQLKDKEIAEKELQLARELQARMLPAPEISGDDYQIAARNLAARYVAGDFYESFTTRTAL